MTTLNNEKKLSVNEVLNGGTIELFSLECFYYVKSVVNGKVKFSEAVNKCKADYFVFDAVHYGNLDF